MNSEWLRKRQRIRKEDGKLCCFAHLRESQVEGLLVVLEPRIVRRTCRSSTSNNIIHKVVLIVSVCSSRMTRDPRLLMMMVMMMTLYDDDEDEDEDDDG